MGNYNPAYSARFSGADGTVWRVSISIEGYNGEEHEVKLDADEPVLIEWQKTKITDAVQSSTCTLRVSNETDRQMTALMTNRLALCTVWIVTGTDDDVQLSLYWRGMLDDSVYEEPYSFNSGYVTELTFSDFGFLNRMPFRITGKHSLREIVDNSLDTAMLLMEGVNQRSSLYYPTQTVTHIPVNLNELFISCDRFSDGDYSQRDVLEETLRPLGLRIMQKKGLIWIYDMEYLRDRESSAVPVVWKGTDACLKGEETFGTHKVVFAPDAEETVIDGSVGKDDFTPTTERYTVPYYDKDESGAEAEDGFYFEKGVRLHNIIFKTESCMSVSDDYGYLYRARCESVDLSESSTPHTIKNVDELFSLQSGYLPIIHSSDAVNFQLRVNLDFLFTVRKNPFERTPAAEGLTISLDTWEENMLRIFIPVKLEVVDERGRVLCYYRNTYTDKKNWYPMDTGHGIWENGALSGFENMVLAYYKPSDKGHLEETPLDGWATNMQTIGKDRTRVPGICGKRKAGEYVPLPPIAGYIKLTVSNGVVGIYNESEDTILVSNDRDINWQLYRNPKVTVVRSNRVNDEITKDDFEECDTADIYDDIFSEREIIGSYRTGVAPCSRGLLFDSLGGVFSVFLKNDTYRTLEEHRMRSIQAQTRYVQPELSGTAELCSEFCARTEASTNGVFLVTASRQDLRLATEYVTMVRLASDNDL